MHHSRNRHLRSYLQAQSLAVIHQEEGEEEEEEEFTTSHPPWPWRCNLACNGVVWSLSSVAVAVAAFLHSEIH
jgi:hypothetical protein